MYFEDIQPTLYPARSTAIEKSVEEKEDDSDDARKPQPEPEAGNKYLYDGRARCAARATGLEGDSDLVISSSSSSSSGHHIVLFDRTQKARLFVGGLHALFSLGVCFACAGKPLSSSSSFEQVRQRQKQDLLHEHRGPSLRRFEAPKRDVR